MRTKNYYDKRYFQERDLLIPHLAQTIKEMILKNRLHKVLDVGCGTGLLVKFLNANHLKAIGSDLSPQAVKVAQKANNKKTIVQAPASRLPFGKNSFDIVTSISTIEHLTTSDAKKFINESKRVLRKNGFIFLVTPNFATPLRIFSGRKWFAYQDPTHINFFTPQSLSSLLTQNGFKNPQTLFRVKYQKSLEWEFPGILGKTPQAIKKILVFAIFATPLAILRNSFWISAQKK